MDGPALDVRPGTAAQRPGNQMMMRASLPPSAMSGDVPPSLKHSVDSWAEMLGQQQPEAAVNPHTADKAAATFRAYDAEGRGHLDRKQMMTALAEMGAVHGMSGKAIEDVLAMDPSNNRNQHYSLGDFLGMYGRLAQYQAKQARDGRIKGFSHVSQAPEGADSNPELRKVFCSYCQFTRGVSRMLICETEMVAQQLHKLCFDIGVLGDGAPLTHAAIDIAFTRCKAPNTRRLTFDQWLRVLCVLSDESGWNLFEMTMQLSERLGTKGFPAPVDPDTVMPLKASNLPKLRSNHSSSGLPPSPVGSADQARPGTAAGGPTGASVMASRRAGASAAGPRGGPSPLRPPRFSNLAPPAGSPGSPAAGAPTGQAMAWGPSPPASSPSARGPRHSQDHLAISTSVANSIGVDTLPSPTSVPIARIMAAMDGKQPWASVQPDPDNMPPWLQQLLERLQQLEAKVDAGGAGSGAAQISERQMGQIRIMMEGQLAQAASAAVTGAVGMLEEKVRSEVDSALLASRSSLPPEGSELAASLAELRSGLQQDVKLLVRTVEESSSANEGMLGRLAALEKEVADLRQSQLDEAQALKQRLQQLEQAAADSGASAGAPGGAAAEGGRCAGCGGLEDRVAKCEERLGGHDEELAALKAAKQLDGAGTSDSAAADMTAAAAAAASSDAAGQSVDDKLAALMTKVGELESQLHAQVTGLASAAASAASGAAKAVEANAVAVAAQSAGNSAAKRLDAAEAHLAAVAAQAKEAATAAAAAAVAAAAATTAATGGVDPALAAKIQALESQVSAAEAKKGEPAAGDTTAKLLALEQQLAALSAALKQQEAAAAASSAALAKLQQQVDAAAAAADTRQQGGMSPAAVAELTEGLRTAAAQQLAEQGAQLSQRIQGVEGRVGALEALPILAAAAAQQEEALRQQLQAMGLTDRVIVQLVRLATLGVDVTVLGELFKKQAELDAELRRRAAVASGASPVGGSFTGGAAAPVADVAAAVEAATAAAGAASAQATQSANVALGSSSKALTEASRALAEAGKATECAARLDAEVQGLRKSAQLMQQAMQVLRREIDGLRPPVARAEAAGKVAAESASAAGRRAEEVSAFAEILAAKHDALADELRGLKATGKVMAELGAAGAAAAAAASGGTPTPGTPVKTAPDSAELRNSASMASSVAGNNSPRMASLEAQIHQLAVTLGETTSRFTVIERDMALALTSYARIVDLKESENHLLDRHQQLHDEMEVLKGNLSQVHEVVFALKAAVVVQQPGAATSSALSGVKSHSLVLGTGGEQILASGGQLVAGQGNGTAGQQRPTSPSMTVRPRTARLSSSSGRNPAGTPVTMTNSKSAPNGALGRPPVGGVPTTPSEYECTTTPPQLRIRRRTSGTGQTPSSPTNGSGGSSPFSMPSAMSTPAAGGMMMRTSPSMLQRVSPALGQSMATGLVSATRQASSALPQMPQSEHGWSEAQYSTAAAAHGQALSPGVRLQ